MSQSGFTESDLDKRLIVSRVVQNCSISYFVTFVIKEVVQFGHGGRAMPAIWFRYELSPITVQYFERRKPFYHFLTTVRRSISDDTRLTHTM